MAAKLQGKKVAFLFTDGVEQIEYLEPRKAVEAAGAEAHLVSLKPGTVQDAVAFARAFFEAGKPVGTICHGPWTLVEAGVVKGRTLTSWPSLRTDIENAGGTWVDEEVQVDQGLVTSRKPDDLKAFGEKLVEEFAEGVHQGQARATARS